MPRDRVIDHKQYVARYGEDMPEVRNWEVAGGIKVETIIYISSCLWLGPAVIQTGYTHLQ